MTFPVNLKDHASHANFPEGGEQWTLPQMLTGLLFPQGERPDDEKVRNRDYTHYDEGVYVGYRHFDKTKAFVKTRSLAAGEVDSIAIKFPVKELRYWNEENKAWALEQGTYNIKVGASSRDVRNVVEISL